MVGKAVSWPAPVGKGFPYRYDDLLLLLLAYCRPDREMCVRMEEDAISRKD